MKYIHLPSGDHAANVQPQPAGPTGSPADLPSVGTSRLLSHCRHRARAISSSSLRDLLSAARREERAFARHPGEVLCGLQNLHRNVPAFTEKRSPQAGLALVELPNYRCTAEVKARAREGALWEVWNRVKGG